MYDSTRQFEPLVPGTIPGPLMERAGSIVDKALRLSSAAHPSARRAIRELVRSMNSYYSNRIESQSTHPFHIESALSKQFSNHPDIARLQRVALAHIEADLALERLVASGQSPMSSAFLLTAHREMYSRLREEDRTEDGRIVIAGEIRRENVRVGHHIPPDAASLPGFMARMDEVFDRPCAWPHRLIQIACLHHRAAWTHPFLDGNGRCARLQSHCALWPLSRGLWSPSRGLARNVQGYYTHLQNADAPRRGDLDGRGKLSTAGLLEWVGFFLDSCDDQVSLMARMLELDGMKARIEALITFRHARDSQVRMQAILPLYYAFAAGPLKRKEFAQMTGLGERTARALLSRLLKDGLLVSDSPLGPVRWGLPLDSLSFLFPELYPEAATKAAD